MISVEQGDDILRKNFAPWVLDLDLGVADTGEDSACLRMHMNPRLNRVGDIASGQALMALADTAMVLAFASLFGELRPVASVNIATSFLRPVVNSAVLAKARVIKCGRLMGFAEVELTTEVDGKLAATAQGTYAMPPPGAPSG